MFNWQVKIIIALALLTVLGGLIMLALPKPQGGPMLVQWAPNHSLYLADLMGVALAAAGILVAWAASLVWQRRRL